MKTRKNTIAVLIILIAVGLGGYLLKDRVIAKNNQLTVEEMRRKQRKADEKTLENSGNADPTALHTAIMRLSSSPSPEIQKKVLALKSSSDPNVRGAVGFFAVNQIDPAAIAVAKELFKDADHRVKVLIAKGLNYVPSIERQPIIRDFLASSGLNDFDRVEAFSALVRSSPTRSERESVQKNLIEYASQEKNKALADASLQQLMNLDPANPAVIELMRKAVQKKNVQTGSVALRTLAVRKDSWLAENLEKVLFDFDVPQFQDSILQSMHFICPINRWTLLEKGYSSEKENARKPRWARTSLQMPGAEANEFLQKILKNEKDDRLKMEVTQILSQSKAMKLRDPCRAQSAL